MDRQDIIAARVREALETSTPLVIRGGNTKSFYGCPVQGEPLGLAGHEGVVEYDPGELVITCRTGTRLEHIRELLSKNGQHLPFEPPSFGAEATIGGTVACGFSGPRRPWSGSLRDYLLGARIVNGKGEVLRFGGQVMKNVAGYDVSRLMAGAMGTLGVLLEVSFKVMPLPARELTLSFDCNQADAINLMNQWAGQPLPLSGGCWSGERLTVRLSGAMTETNKAATLLSPDDLTENQGFWIRLREHRETFFDTTAPLWRISAHSTADPLALSGNFILDWGGALRWYSGPESAEEIRRAAEAAGGHAILFRGESEGERFHPLQSAMQRLHQRVRQAFDPHNLFNPGRMGPGR